jgi:D-alanine--D-alanine ligase
MDIVVLAGGISTEREVSISTGRMICKALRENNHKAIILDVYFGDEEIDLEEPFTLAYNLEYQIEKIEKYNSQVEETKKTRKEFFGSNVLAVCKKADIVFMALHGEQGENGKVQAFFDLMGIRYTGTGQLGSALAMDKHLAKQMFLQGNIPTPKGVMLKKENYSPNLEAYGMKFPCVVKPCCGGSSIGVFIVSTIEEYEEALREAFSFEDEIMVEEYVKGREFSIGIIGDKVFPIIEIAPLEGFYNYENKYQAGMAVETCPADLSDEITKKMQRYANEVFILLRLEAYGRIDFLLNEKNEIFCLEANTLPGMTPTSLLPQEAAAVGIDFAGVCELLMEESLKKYRA